ncbi:energy transducer TonB [Phascolarctobacterium succinatutens]|uniref:energy transducer TonB n=1 Tax=Phascolarctobacterium succinatutens TaxID=626940 RepID=UPI0023EFB577|nr:energy transducer TonB [Phascolarctobacterium succinatutens]
MKDEQKRFGKGFAVALAVHLVLAAGLGIFGYRFVHTPPEILEVSLESGGGGAEAQEEEIEQEEQQEEPVIQSLEDIIDQKLKPKPQKKVVRKKATAASGPKAPAGNPTGNGTGTGTDSGTGSGSGSGNGSGSGEGRGVPVKPPRLLREVAPVYPASARNSGATGVVTVRILVGADGSVEDVTVVGSSGNSAMDSSVVTAVNKWRFSPAKDKYGQNARCRVTRAVSFNLR